MTEPIDREDSQLFAMAFAGLGLDESLLVPWEARSVEIGARRLERVRGGELLQQLWSRDKYMRQLGPDAITKAARFFDFSDSESNREIIRQDEYGNFMVVVLTGTVAVDRLQPWGERLRLAEARRGEILGEMSLLDSGIRFSSCTTMSPCSLAVLSAEAMDHMLVDEPRVAASLVALLARKLSLRLRVVSARLSGNGKSGQNA